MKRMDALLLLMLLSPGSLCAQPNEAPTKVQVRLLPPARLVQPDSGTQPLPPDKRADLPTPDVGTTNPHPWPRVVRLQDVLVSVEQHYPLLTAAFQERVIASGKALSAEGNFDTQLGGHVIQNQGSFDSQRYRMDFTQPTAFQGISFAGGWRLGAGTYPVYYQDRQTAQGGEVFGAVNLPLLKDREIDSRRAGLRQAMLDQQLAEPVIAIQRLRFVRDASKAYWTWIAAVRRYLIGQNLLRIAEQRDGFLRQQAKLGNIAEIEITDNRRTIQDRRARLVLLQRQFEQASIDLSLFMRDEQGKPIRLTDQSLAPQFPEPTLLAPDELIQGVDLALSQRPELKQIRIQLDRAGVGLHLAENQTLPDLRLLASHATDVGEEKKSLDRYAYQAALILEVPLQRRQARGQIRTLQGQMAQLWARELFLRESITTEVQNAISAILRAYEVVQRLREAVRLAEVMEAAERRRLELGQSNILFVNLRELARADAQARAVDALADYFRARADYRAVVGLGVPVEWLPVHGHK